MTPEEQKQTEKDEFKRRQTQRNWVVGGTLLFFAVLFYAITIAFGLGAKAMSTVTLDAELARRNAASRSAGYAGRFLDAWARDMPLFRFTICSAG